MLSSEVRPTPELAVGHPTEMLQCGAAIALLASALIHAMVVPEHLAEWWLAGVFFGVLVYAEVASAVFIASGSRRAPLLAIGLTGLTAAVWMISRSSGLPFGPGAGVPEPAGRADLTATALELVTFALLVPLLWRRTAPLVLGTLHRGVRIAGTALTVLVLGATGIVARPPGSGVHSHHDPTHNDLVVSVGPNRAVDPN